MEPAREIAYRLGHGDFRALRRRLSGRAVAPDVDAAWCIRGNSGTAGGSPRQAARNCASADPGGRPRCGAAPCPGARGRGSPLRIRGRARSVPENDAPSPWNPNPLQNSWGTSRVPPPRRGTGRVSSVTPRMAQTVPKSSRTKSSQSSWRPHSRCHARAASRAFPESSSMVKTRVSMILGMFSAPLKAAIGGQVGANRTAIRTRRSATRAWSGFCPATMGQGWRSTARHPNRRRRRRPRRRKWFEAQIAQVPGDRSSRKVPRAHCAKLEGHVREEDVPDGGVARETARALPGMPDRAVRRVAELEQGGGELVHGDAADRAAIGEAADEGGGLVGGHPGDGRDGGRAAFSWHDR